MGDAGSILLGFCFAAMIFRISADRAEFVCMASFLFPFYADVLTTMGIRIKAGENITQPHRRHLYQILVNEFGFTHWSVSIAYGMMQLIVAMGVLMMKNYGITAVLMLLLFFFVVFCAVSFHIRNRMR